ncbi:MAG: hypothetical protein KBT03_13615 [Bacteroidales bacterium]|nr:hypothetical protein [Candidatus Scybalousia scybalohippi]
MSEELTKKLKQGNLKDGYYYAKMPTGCVDVVSLYNLRQLRLAKDGDKIEVLSPVPSFDETVMMITLLDKMEEEIKELKTKSAKALEYYNKVNINRNYPDKVSQLKSYIKRLIEEREKLKKQLEMLLNPKNVTENVSNQKVQHCEKRTDE